MTDQIQLTRSKFLLDLLAEVDQADESAFPPAYEFEKGDRKLGEISPWLRKLHSLMRFYARECKRMKVDQEFEPAGGDPHANCVAYSRMKYKYDVLNEIFWACLRSEFEAWHEPSVGVRSGWVAVESQVDENEVKRAGFKKFLGGILGAGFSAEE